MLLSVYDIIVNMMPSDKKEAFYEWLKTDGSIRFDIFSRNLEDSIPLQEIIPGLVVSSAGGFGLFQAEGLLKGYPFYFRAEQGGASLKVGAADSDFPYLPSDALWISNVQEGYTEYGMTYDEFLYAMVNLVPNLKPSPFLWEFETYRVTNFTTPTVDTSKRDIIRGWGHTSFEGYLSTLVYPAWLEQRGVTIETWEKCVELMDINPEPVNIDDRIYPYPLPLFEVNV